MFDAAYYMVVGAEYGAGDGAREGGGGDGGGFDGFFSFLDEGEAEEECVGEESAEGDAWGGGGHALWDGGGQQEGACGQEGEETRGGDASEEEVEAGALVA
jgi:hypothetical protein